MIGSLISSDVVTEQNIAENSQCPERYRADERGEILCSLWVEYQVKAKANAYEMRILFASSLFLICLYNVLQPCYILHHVRYETKKNVSDDAFASNKTVKMRILLLPITF